MKTIIDKNASAIDVMKRAGTIEKLLVKTNSSRFIVSLRDEPLLAVDVLDPNKKDEIRCTTGSYFIKYSPTGDKFFNPKYPYTIKTSDMLGWNLCVSGPQHLAKVKMVFPEVAWILRNSTFDDVLFGIAKSCPGAIVPFCLDVVRYSAMITAKMNARGIDPTENKPFVTFKFADKLPHVTVDEKDFWPNKDEARSKYFAVSNAMEHGTVLAHNK